MQERKRIAQAKKISRASFWMLMVTVLIISLGCFGLLSYLVGDYLSMFHGWNKVLSMAVMPLGLLVIIGISWFIAWGIEDTEEEDAREKENLRLE